MPAVARVPSPVLIGVFDIVVAIGMEGVVVGVAGSGDDGVGVDGSCVVGNVCAVMGFEFDNGVDGGDDDIG